MQIIESIIHRTAKNKNTTGPDSVNISCRDAALPLDEKVTLLGEEVLKLYSSLSNGYGTLGNGATHQFPIFLADYTAPQQVTGFIGFSKDTVDLIAESMHSQSFTTTSYPLFIRYTNQGRDWILIAVLKLKEGVGINTETLDLNESLSFDIHDLREAARIDILKWQNNEQPYLSFIKRGSGTSSSEYFRKALSCLDYVDAKHHTDAAMSALDAYCDANNLTSDEKIAAHNTFYEYCDEKKHRGEAVNLASLSTRINDQEPNAFIDYVKEQEFPINETFSPHKSSYAKLRRIKKTFGTINLSFDVNDLSTGRIILGDDKKSIIIPNPSKDLVSSINSALGTPEPDNE